MQIQEAYCVELARVVDNCEARVSSPHLTVLETFLVRRSLQRDP